MRWDFYYEMCQGRFDLFFLGGGGGGEGSTFSLFHEFLFICSGMLVCILSYIFKSPVVVLSQCECDPGKETCRMSYVCLKTEKAVKFQLESVLKKLDKIPKMQL